MVRQTDFLCLSVRLEFLLEMVAKTYIVVKYCLSLFGLRKRVWCWVTIKCEGKKVTSVKVKFFLLGLTYFKASVAASESGRERERKRGRERERERERERVK
jgi:hypothetical protein